MSGSTRNTGGDSNGGGSDPGTGTDTGDRTANRLTHDAYCTELATQAQLFGETVRTGDLGMQVPTCPDWTLRDLTVHLGSAYRWMAETVRTRAADHVPRDQVPQVDGPADDDSPAALHSWFAASADLLTGELRAAGPDVEVWTWGPDRSTFFWARRATHESVIHRADACAAVDADFAVDPTVAADALDEWLDILTYPATWEYLTSMPRLAARAGDTLHLHATNSPMPAGEWLINLQDTGLSWSHTHTKATVALRGPLPDILLVFLCRLPVDSPNVEVLGDAGLLDFWLEHVSFG